MSERHIEYHETVIVLIGSCVMNNSHCISKIYFAVINYHQQKKLKENIYLGLKLEN